MACRGPYNNKLQVTISFHAWLPLRGSSPSTSQAATRGVPEASPSKSKLMTVADAAMAGTAAVVVVPGLLKTGAVLALKAFGFTSLGPAAGSLAAKWMSSIAVVKGGGIAAGSVYAVLQHSAMTLPLVTPAAVVVGTGAGIYYSGRRWFAAKAAKRFSS